MIPWFWEVGGTILASRMTPSVIQAVAVVEQAPGRLGGGAAHHRPGLHRHRRLLRPLVGRDDPQGLLHGVEHLHGPDDDALKGVAAYRPQAGLPGRLPGQGGEAVKVQVVAGQGTDKIGAPPFQAGVQGVGMGDVLLDEVLLVVLDRNIQPLIGDHPAFVEGIFRPWRRATNS